MRVKRIPRPFNNKFDVSKTVCIYYRLLDVAVPDNKDAEITRQRADLTVLVSSVADG